MNKAQIGKVRVMLANAGINNEKEKKEFVMMVTQRTDSLSACTQDETKTIIAYLEANSPQPETLKQTVSRAAEKQRRYIISMAHQMHWYKPRTKKVDMQRVDNWCIQYSGYGKPLDEIDDTMLPALVTQFQKVLKSFLNAL